jgi:carboxylesterase type B
MPARTPQEPGSKPVPDTADSPELLGDSTTEEQSLDALRARIKALEAENEKLAAEKDVATEESARLSAQAQSALLMTGVVERLAGKTSSGEDLWWYRIDLAPGGGTHVMINGKPYLHGETYKFDTNTLRTVKEIVARTWVHENDIHGHAFNPYRRQQQKIIRPQP